MRYSITIRVTGQAMALAVVALGGCAPGPAAPDHAAARPPAMADPLASPAGGGETGTATWYGSRHHGRRTASGEVFDRHGMTAAHARLPLGTRVRVTNPATGQSVVVRINDRCRCPGVMIDLSEGAARAIGMRSTMRVRMERL
jgi:rare lipoprotein A